jgi:NADH:ubiquinone oxidoreductase subunit 6 (subunit J)
MEGFIAVVSVIVMIGVVGYLVWSLLRSIREQQRSSGVRKIWPNFGLSIVLLALFAVSWATHGVAQWQQFVNEQRTHGEPVLVNDFLVDFAEATLENWQSEFLQLFSFVVLAAVFIHRGSAESKDSDDRMEEMLKEIKQKLDA